MTWIDKFRNWDYSVTPIIQWLLDLTEYHVQRYGWPAYVGIAILIIAAGLALPITRGVTSQIVSGTFKLIFGTLQLIVSLIVVQLAGFLAKVLLAQFHRTRRWITQVIANASGK